MITFMKWARGIGIFLLVLFLFVLANSASSQPAVVLHGQSYHSVGQYNNRNYGIGYRTNDRLVLGAYHNSEGGASAYLGYDWRLNSYTGLVLAGAVGYDKTPVLPIVMPYLTLPIVPRIRFNIGLSPILTDTNKVGVLVHTMLEYRL